MTRTTTTKPSAITAAMVIRALQDATPTAYATGDDMHRDAWTTEHQARALVYLCSETADATPQEYWEEQQFNAEGIREQRHCGIFPGDHDIRARIESTRHAVQLATDAAAAELRAHDADRFIRIRTGERSNMKIMNTRERIAEMVATVRRSPGLFGGGTVEKPAKARPAVSWKPRSVAMVWEMLQDGDAAGALDLADTMGALFFSFSGGSRGTGMTWAPLPVEGMPAGFVSARRCDGEWTVFHAASMLAMNGAGKPTSRANAEQRARDLWNSKTESAQAHALQAAANNPQDQAEARAAWITLHSITTEAEATQHDETTDTSTATPEPMVQIVSGLTGAYLGLLHKSAAHAMAQRHGNTIGTPAPADYTITAARQVSELIASATTAAAIEHASERPTEAQHQDETEDAHELATVDAEAEADTLATTCDASSAGNAGSAPTHGHASSSAHQAPTVATPGTYWQHTGQQVSGKSGNWCALMFTDDAGRPSFEFDGHGKAREVLSFATGRERMAALQAMAREADDAADQSNDASDADQSPAEQAGIESIKDAIRMNEREMERVLKSKQKGSKESAYRIELIIAELADKLSDALKASKSTTTTGEYQQPAPVPKTETEADTKAADKVPRAVVLDSGQQSTSGTDTADKVPRAVVLDSGQQSTSGTDTADEVPRAVVLDSGQQSTSGTDTADEVPRAVVLDSGQQSTSGTDTADEVPRAVGADSGPASNPPDATAPSAPAPSAPAPSAPAPSAPAPADQPGADESEPEFTRTAPQPFDMLAMIAAGLAPDDFVGLGIVYSGDRANPSGRGAITDVQPCSWYKYTVTVTLEDGRQSRLNPVSFTEHLGNRYKTDFKRHGAPYLAELTAARLAIEAADKAAKQAAADDKARQRRELPQQWPQLKAYDPAGKLNGPTLAAHNIRVLLKERFPKIKFSVKSDRYSGGDAIDIRWTDGPNTKAVEKIADQFEAGSFNGQEDIYEYSRSVFRDLFGDAKYIHCNRDISDAMLAQAIEAEYPSAEGRPTVEDYRKARGAFSYGHRNEWAARRIRERLETMGAGLPS